MPSRVTQAEYKALAGVRYRIRRFLTFSESAARAAGIEPKQHQLLLAIRALPPAEQPTIKTVAERLQVRHNSAVELATRAAGSGLIERHPGADDAREVTLHLTAHGARILERLSRTHRTALRTAGKDLVRALRTLDHAAGVSSVR